MARIIHVCLRDPSQSKSTVRAVEAVARRLAPENLASQESRTTVNDGVIACIVGADDHIATRGGCLAAGHLVDPDRWELIGREPPDGAFALFRSDERHIELVSDALASRTVWYVLTEDSFISSTSQRAIVALLESFEFNDATVPWMLAAGTLGTRQSWDRRIRPIPGATCVTLDRESWLLRERSSPVCFEPREATDEHWQGILLEIARHAVGATALDDASWAIALSGGIDCRAILCLLPDRNGLRAITWGLRESRDDPNNDAVIAGRLARHFGLEHCYFATDIAPGSVEQVMRRFVANGEGRVDRLSGYMDGFDLWQQITAAGISGIVRGDEAFGRQSVRTDADVRAYMPQWSDFPALPPLEHLGLPPQAVDERLLRRPGESLETWRDRLQHEYRVPCILGALGDLKYPFVEVVNPLLSGSLVRAFRELPDRLRTDKLLLRRIAQSLSPDIPFATRSAIQAGDHVLESAAFVELMRDRLAAGDIERTIPREFSAFALSQMVGSRGPAPGRGLHRRVRRAVRSSLPEWVSQRRVVVTPPRIPDHNRLAFRAMLVSDTVRLLEEDARFLQGQRAHSSHMRIT